jgi:hemoglobin-like flavoprotein
MAFYFELLNESFRAITQEGEAFVESFYQNLFAEAPETRMLFSEDMEAQRRKLLLSLTTIVGALDKPELLNPYLQELGRTHQQYNVTPRYYAVAGQALLKTLADYFGEDWSPQLQIAWTEAYEGLPRSC